MALLWEIPVRSASPFDPEDGMESRLVTLQDEQALASIENFHIRRYKLPPNRRVNALSPVDCCRSNVGEALQVTKKLEYTIFS
jgi:hypothetical protein